MEGGQEAKGEGRRWVGVYSSLRRGERLGGGGGGESGRWGEEGSVSVMSVHAYAHQAHISQCTSLYMHVFDTYNKCQQFCTRTQIH